MIIWSPGITLEQLEKQVILKAYEFYNKNSGGVAKALNVEVEYVNKKLLKYENTSKEDEVKRNSRKLVEAEFNLRARGITTLSPTHTLPPKIEFKKSSLKKAELKIDA